jgi:hypothetical protein
VLINGEHSRWQRDVAVGQVAAVDEGQAYLERVTAQLDRRGLPAKAEDEGARACRRSVPDPPRGGSPTLAAMRTTAGSGGGIAPNPSSETTYLRG